MVTRIPPSDLHSKIAHTHPLAISIATALAIAFFLGGCGGQVATLAVLGDAEQIKHMAERGENLEQRDWQNRSPLELAIMTGQADAVQALVDSGVELERYGKNGLKPIHWASRRSARARDAAGSRATRILEILLAAKVDPSSLDLNGDPPLLHALKSGTDEHVELLLFAGADAKFIIVKRARGTLLHAAISYKKIRSIELLTTAGADPDALTTGGLSARRMAERRPRFRDAIERGLRLRSATSYATQTTPPPATSPTITNQGQAATPGGTHAPVWTPTPAVTSTGGSSSPAQTGVPGNISFGRYYALVIGNAEYRHLPRLETAVRDAQSISRLLREAYDFEVETLTDATRADILQALARYRKTLGANDNLLIYYAGHGTLDEDADRGYWLPVDATDTDEIFWIANGSITSAARAIEAKHIMVVADSCYSGKLTRGLSIQHFGRMYTIV